MRFRPACILASLLCAVINLSAQEIDSGFTIIPVDKYLRAVSYKSAQLQHRLDRSNQKALKKFQRLERKIQQRVARIDSLRASEIFGNSEEHYNRLGQKLGDPESLQSYLPAWDTINTSLKFLQQYPQILSKTPDVYQKLNEAMSNVHSVEKSLQGAEEIKKFLKERHEYLKNQLSNLGFVRELKSMSRNVYYEGARINEYKSLLKDHKKAEKKALELLSKSKLFQSFMHKHSMLASLFRLPVDPNDPSSQPASMAGLQTRSQVNGLIQQQISAGGPNAQQQLQQNMQSAQAQITDLKQKFIRSGSASSDDILPDGVRVNPMKTKSFLQRLEFGTNIQSHKANGFSQVVASDIGLSIGYKLNGRSIVGIQGSYRVGWGRNIRHIKITHQGMGIRSFIDWKIKGSFWLTAGYEMNYRSEFDNVDVLKDLDAWQRSWLIGVSKVVSMKTKVFKKTKLQLFWDILSYRQMPRTEAVIFRVGYNF